MSYSDFLRTKQLNQAVIIDRRQKLGDASNYIQRTKLGASWIQGSTDHVINNSLNTSYPRAVTNTQANRKMPIKYAGSGAGGRVQDASLYTLTRGAAAIGADIFSSTKTVQREFIPCAIRASPAPSLVVTTSGNFDGSRIGLNQGYQEPCPVFQPLGNTQLVVRNPALDRLGVTSREAWNGATGTNYGVQNTFDCASTLTTANHDVKLIRHGNLNSRPARADFRTAIMGPQVPEDGSMGRPGKLGGLIAKTKYIEKHAGNPNIGHPPIFKPPFAPFSPSYRIPKNA